LTWDMASIKEVSRLAVGEVPMRNGTVIVP
jgi:hypothetical protein